MTLTDPISKTEGARRQLDTAIDLFFDNADSLSVHTLAFAGLKVLFDLYPHRKDDGFAAQLDAVITKEGWKAMAGVANFLKHADRDPDAFLRPHHPRQGMAIIGLATLLYRRVHGEFSRKMMAFDFWVEEEGYEELGIEEVDTNEERATKFKEVRDKIRALPHEAKMLFARRQYRHFLDNFERLHETVAKAEAKGLTIVELLDRELR